MSHYEFLRRLMPWLDVVILVVEDEITAGCEDRRLGKLHFWIIFMGGNLTFLPVDFLGVAGMPRRIPDYPEALPTGTWSPPSARAGALLFLCIVVYMVRSGVRVVDNPWGAGAMTLEWSVSSPAPFHTFEQLPRIR